MQYLIDGHNLIAQMADIQLSDADDEEKLVRRLRKWMAAGRRRQVTLFFDGGLPGGPARHLSGGALKVIFASVGRDADTLIIRRIQKARNPPEFTVISSDRAILAAAQARGMPAIDSQTFARMLDDEARGRVAGKEKSHKEDPSLDAGDIARWLDIFGAEEGRDE